MAVSPKPSQICRLPYSTPRQQHQAADGWLHQQLPRELGDCQSQSLPLTPGLTLVRSHYRPNRPLIEEARSSHQGRLLVITCALQGTSDYQDANGSSLTFAAGHSIVSAFQASQGERRYAANQPVAQLRLLVEEHLLDHYMGHSRARQLLGQEPLRLLANAPTAAACISHARALAQPCGQSPAASLDLHIHALSLLSLHLQALAPAVPAQGQRLSSSDLDKLQQVRELMFQQMHQPLTLAYLCAAVGLNQHKLKQGLRQHYQTTPQRMLLEIRMQQALILLQSGCQVAQVAYQVGYGFPGNFSAAFSRFYGKSPKTVFGPRR